MRVLIGVLLAAVNLRIAIAAIGPIIDDVREDTGMSSALAGVLTATPFICLAVFMVLGAALVRRVGFARLLWISLVLVAAGSVVRVVPGNPVILLLGTVPIGIGIAFVGALLPGIVRRHFADRAGAVTGAWVATQSGAAAIAALTIVPLAAAFGGWRWALGATAVPAVVALLLWPVAGVRASDMDVAPSQERRRGPSRVAVKLGLVFGGQAMCFSATMAWIAAVYADGGWSTERAALATAAVMVLTVPASLVAPTLSDGRDRRLWIAGLAFLMAVGFCGMALALESAPWVWLSLAGVGLGAVFPLILSVAVDVGGSAHEATELTAWMQGIGYVLAAAAPVAVGALRDMTGGFGAGMVLLAVVAAGIGALALLGLPRPTAASSRPARAAAR